MLTRMRLENLKTWGEQLWADGVRLSPLTLLLGTNSAGKTSLLQVPLLLKQTFRGPDRLAHLNLGGHRGDLVNLGTYESVIHNHEIARELGLGLTVQPAADDEAPIDYAATFVAERGRPVVSRLELARDGRSFSATRQPNGTYRLAAPDDRPLSLRARAARRAFEPQRAVAFSRPAIAALGPAGVEVQQLSRGVREALDDLAYLGPLREYPERAYLWTGPVPRDLGRKGERAAHALMADAAADRQGGDDGGQDRLIDRVSTWLARLGVADALVLQRRGNSRSCELVVVRGKQRSNIVDVGFGVSQVLPFIVLAYTVPPGGTIITEQPELHLHPRAQRGLADLIVEVARERRVQFLVETHSEHLFRRLQTLLAEEQLTPADCALYFVDAARDEAVLTRLGVDEFGRVANWPKQFFGDAVGETETQMRRMLERAAAKRQDADG